MKYKLYGDGIHDDTLAIQEMLDTLCEVKLPEPENFYLISKSLEIGSNKRLTLPQNATIKLKDASNCVMVKNKTVDDFDEQRGCKGAKLFDFYRMYSPDYQCEDIEIKGGIWDCNNKGQNPNPILTGNYEPYGYTGFGMLFYNVKNLRISDLTMKDPVNFSITLDTVSDFTVKNITFDFNDGNPYQANMDGVHINGNCCRGIIENLYGTCYDDMVALNAEEGSRGNISDITVKGIYTDYSYSAVRLLSSRPEASIKNVHISDICGKFYHFTISFMQHYDTGCRGLFENITIENVTASKADRNLINFPIVNRYPIYPIIELQEYTDIKNLKISNVKRRETFLAVPTIQIREKCNVENLGIDNISSDNLTGEGRIESFRVDSDTANISNLEIKNVSEDGMEVDYNITAWKYIDTK